MSEQKNIDFEKIKKLWIDTSDQDFNTMINLFNTGDYHWALFIGHIVIERLLKAYYVQERNDHPPFTHDLLRTAKLAELNIDNEKSDWLDTITTFNINARYDSYKEEFYKKCTYDYAGLWITRIKELREWIKEKY